MNSSEGIEPLGGSSSEGPKLKKQKKLSTNNLQLPTRDEQLYLRETENLFKTNLLRLQVNELLNEIRTSEKLPSKVDKWANFTVQKLLNIKREPGAAVIDRKFLKRNGLVHLELINPDAVLNFVAPVEVNIVGSSRHQTATKPHLNIDITVTIPDEVFDEKDVLNYGYFDKRKLYLAALAVELNVEQSEARLALFKGDPRKPILVLCRPSQEVFKTSYEIRIIPTIVSGATMKKSALSLTKNNVRPQWWQDEVALHRQKRMDAAGQQGKKSKNNKAEVSPLALDVTRLQPTPEYNMCLLEDMVLNAQHGILTAVFGTHCPVARDVVLLLKVWLTQTTMRFRHDGVDGHTISLLVAFLVQHRLIQPAMTAVQGFQTTLKFIADWKVGQHVWDFAKPSLKENTSTSSSEDAQRWLAVFAANLLHPVTDTTGSGGGVSVMYNVFWRVSQSAMLELQSESGKALELLQHHAAADGSGSGVGGQAFESVFLRRTRLAQKFDMFFHMPIVFGKESTFGQTQSLVNVGNPLIQRVASAVRSVLTYGLSDRVSVCNVIPRYVSKETAGESKGFLKSVTSCHSPSLPIGVPTPPDGGCWMITVGIVINHSNGNRRVDKDTGAKLVSPHNSLLDNTEAGQSTEMNFAQFWGAERCKLRRFQDGEIVDAVVWGRDGAEVGADCNRAESIVAEIVQHCVNKHIPSRFFHHLHYVGNQLEKFLPCNSVDASTILSPGNAGTSPATPVVAESAINYTRKAVEALDALRNILLTRMDGVPLTIERLSSSSASLRYTALFPPTPHILALDTAQRKAAVKAAAGGAVNRLSTPLLLVATLETSSHWPTGDGEAMNKTRLAYLIRLSEQLQQQFKVQCSIVQFENAAPVLDIFYEGFIFRMQICARDSQGKMILFTTPDGYSVTGADRVASEISTETWSNDIRNQLVGSSATHADLIVHEHTALYLHRCFSLAPQHHQMIHHVHTQHGTGTYCNTVRLFSYWLAAQLFSGQMAHEVVELLVASVFPTALDAEAVDKVVSSAVAAQGSASSDNHGVRAPSTTTSGLLSSLLRLVEHDWSTTPLVVCAGAEEGTAHAGTSGTSTVHMMKQGAQGLDRAALLRAAKLSYDKARHTKSVKGASSGNGYGGLSMFITTPYESTSVGHRAVFCQSLPQCGNPTPEAMVLRMMQVQAKATADILMQWMEGVTAIPTSAVDAFDADHVLSNENKFLRRLMKPNPEMYSHSNCVLRFNKNICMKLPSNSSGNSSTSGSDLWRVFASEGGAPFSKLSVFTNLPAVAMSSKSLVVRQHQLPHPLQDEVVSILRHNFHSNALFFWNHLDGREVQVVFKPRALVPQKFSIVKTHLMTPSSSDDDELVFNTKEAIGDMVNLANGLIEDVIQREDSDGEEDV